MDLDKIQSTVINLVSDFYVGKDLTKHAETINSTLKEIKEYLDQNFHRSDDPDLQAVMALAYWCYRIKEDQKI